MDLRGRIRARGKKVLGVGSALTDILVQTSDEVLRSISDIKGGMTLVESEFLDGCLPKVPQDKEIVPGGAACNTIQGLARLGGDTVFVGKRGNDATGEAFESSLRISGVKPVLSTSLTPSGRVLSIITPDAQRSMFTFLGASSELRPADLPEDLFSRAAIVFMEGYLFFNPDLGLAVLEKARAAGAVTAMDLASFTVVEAAPDLLHRVIPEYVDILIANEDEAQAYTGYSDPEKALEAMASEVDLAVLKLGSEGSRIRMGHESWVIDACAGQGVRDTTGAGDLWAAGFLHGLVEDWPMERCGNLASACGYEVCCVVGAQIPEAGWSRIASRFLSPGGSLPPSGS
ncbi:adenosine kinase [Desulfobotulus mexicanus]|uniref:Adenosine kinase n=1 Tax=Desulfobotulus mexicanus TaxID=2586642 RepID=A0A5Q4VIQ2_9BACT|nr:adenosine kinase [Desulfobotulus mexicanus]TYT76097.1 adenosine kinase [Desulfobotulus mexicanus]